MFKLTTFLRIFCPNAPINIHPHNDYRHLKREIKISGCSLQLITVIEGAGKNFEIYPTDALLVFSFNSYINSGDNFDNSQNRRRAIE